MLEGERGIAYFDAIGFFGVLFGAAGSGKSILSIQLCCRFVQGNTHGAQNLKRSAIYLTQERAALISAKLEDFKFFEGGSIPIFLNGIAANSASSQRDYSFDKPGLHIIQMPLEVQLQKAQLENIFNAVSQAIGAGIKAGKKRPHDFCVCVDNAETIADDAYLALSAPHSQNQYDADVYGVRTQKDRNFFKLLRAYCANRCINAFFVFEEKTGEGTEADARDVATTAQAYAADIVIRLGVHVFPSGYKERTVEIVKAKNQYYRRGRHHFSIVGRANSDETRQVGIVIYPSMATQLHKCRASLMGGTSKQRPSLLPSWSIGIPDLDHKVARELGLKPRGKRLQGYLAPGTVSVLVSDLDVRANDIALHFAFQGLDDKEEHRKGKSGEHGKNPDAKPDTSGGMHGRHYVQPLYLSLVHQQTPLAQALRRFQLFVDGPTLQPVTAAGGDGNFFYFVPEHISEGKLLRDISEMLKPIEKARGRRVVVDNLFGIKARWPLVEDVHHFLATLFSLFRERQVVALVVDMVEVGEGRNPIRESFAAGLADNVFMLRHVELHSQAHTAFSVLKMMGRPTPSHLWDLVEVKEIDDDGSSHLEARDTFSFYKHVLSGRPEPVGITMSVHADCEGSPLDEFLKVKEKALTQPAGRIVRVHRYARDEYSHFQNGLFLASKHPLSDCHIISVDENWIEHLLENDLLEEIGQYLKADEFKRWQFDNREAYVTAGQDLALTYMRVRRRPSGHSTSDHYARWYLVPDRNNCGVLCLDEDAWSNSMVNEKKRSAVMEVFGCAPEEGQLSDWITHIGPTLTWNHIMDVQKRFQALSRGTPKPGVFSFCMDQLESCVCFLLELALSREVGEPIVDEDRTINLSANVRWKNALEDLLHLLDRKEKQYLSCGNFRQSVNEPSFLFSRQWFSTWGTLRYFTHNEQAKSLRRVLLAELPKGEGKVHPTPVSGAWYLGILRGSAAVRAGVQVIKQFTSDEDNLFKLNRGIGLPVRSSWYVSDQCPEVLVPLPYRRQFVEIAQAQGGSTIGRKKKYEQLILKGDYPFYRMHIKHYDAVAPILQGIVVQAAKANADKGCDDGLVGIKEILQFAQARYNRVMALRQESSKRRRPAAQKRSISNPRT